MRMQEYIEEPQGITIDPAPFIEFYRNASIVIRRFFIEGLVLAADGRAEGHGLRKMMEFRIKSNETGIAAQLNPLELNGLYHRLSMIDSITARYLLSEFMDRGAGVAVQDWEDDFELLDEDAIESLPDTKPLIHGSDPSNCIIPQESIGMLVAPPKTGKSFLALSWALAVANGSDWLDYKVEGGPVVYFTGGEGTSGWKKRVRAAKAHMGIDRTKYGFYMRKTMVDLRDTTMVDIIADKFQAMNLRPRMIIIDTLHRHTPGSDEMVKDMGQFLGNCSRLLELTDKGTVLIIHHPNKADSEDPRGSGSLDGYLDYSMVLKRFTGTGQLILKARYYKDFDEFEPIRLKMHSVWIDGKSSAPVVVKGDNIGLPKPDEKEKQVIRALADCPGSTFTEIQHAIGMPKSTLSRTINRMIDKQLIMKDEEGRYTLIEYA